MCKFQQIEKMNQISKTTKLKKKKEKKLREKKSALNVCIWDMGIMMNINGD
jgi:ribosomal protein S12